MGKSRFRLNASFHRKAAAAGAAATVTAASAAVWTLLVIS